MKIRNEKMPELGAAGTVQWAGGVNESAPAPKELSMAKLPQVVGKLHGNNIRCCVELKAVEPRGHGSGLTPVTYIHTVRRSKSSELL